MTLALHLLAGGVRRRVLLLLAVITALALVASRAGAQEGAEIVRGRVTAPDGRPMAGVTVTVTGTQSRDTRTTRTNDKGIFTVLFGGGEGEYLVQVRSVGHAPRTIRVARSGESNVIAADVAMGMAPAQLAPVSVTAGRARPSRTGDRHSIGGSERDATYGALFSLDPSDINALALRVPGLRPVPGPGGDSSRFSALGASPDQNNVTLDGSTLDGSTLPRDAIGSVRVATTTFDPSRGQFSGAQVIASTRGGGIFHQGVLRGTGSDRHVAWTDPAWSQPVPTTGGVSGMVGGPFNAIRARYLGTFDVQRQTSDAFSLLEPRSALLEQRGLSRDTVASLSDLLATLGVPLRGAGIPALQVSDRQSALGKLDFIPTATTSLSIRANGTWQRQGGVGLSAFSYPTAASRHGSDQASVQLSGSTYLGGFLAEARTALNHGRSSSAPYLALPGGNVRVGATYDDGRTGLSSLQFGGGSSAQGRMRSTRWETTTELSWMDDDTRHRLKVGQMTATTTGSRRSIADPFGSYTYQSLADLAANRPASYQRTLDSRVQSDRNLQLAGWVGDQWRASKTMQVELGMRVDAERAANRPAYNPVVDSLFGLRTDRVPRSLGWSPRVGFNWTPWGNDEQRWVAATLRMAGVRDSAAPPRSRRESIVDALRLMSVSGGVGAFRGVIPQGHVASLVELTGLPNTTRRLSCVGDATPVPDWSVSDVSPSACLDGTAPDEFSASQPAVMVLDRSYRAPVSWRGNLNAGGLRAGRWQVGLGVTHSINLQGESRLDENLRRTPAFRLASEGGRPVYADSSLIVPATGAVAPGASRVHAELGTVHRVVSDLRSHATQVDVSLSPSRPLFGKLPLNIGYAWSRQRAQERAIGGGSTAGDPFAREWAAGQQPAHQFQVGTSWQAWWLSMMLMVRATSGVPFTPMVAGDVNGDGQHNDRAFVFGDEASGDPRLTSEMRTLLGSADGYARDCLRAQLGRVAGRNSCRTGWIVTPDLRVNFNPRDDFGFGNRLRATLNLSNASGAAFRLLGLSDTPLGRASLRGQPDPTLLYVDGFDAATGRYRYRVNQRFGDTRTAGRRARQPAAPFQAQLGLEWSFGGPPRMSMAQNLGLVQERGKPALTLDEARARLRQLQSSPARLLLEMRDSLGLDTAQVRRIESVEAAYLADMDSVLTPVAEWVVGRGRKVTDADLFKRLAKMGEEVQRTMLDRAAEATEVLRPAQVALLPPFWVAVLRAAEEERRKRK